jgi:DNA primase large subunit
MVEMLVSRLEYAKYPFMKATSEYVRTLDLRLEEMEKPEYVEIVKRAVQRVLETLTEGTVSWKGDRLGEAEILSFPVAVAIVVSIADSFLKRRFATAETKRVYALLREEKEQKIMEIANSSLGWKATLTKMGSSKTTIIALDFVDYLRNAVRFNDDRWKLVNRVLTEGRVLLRKDELARLMAEEVNTRFEIMLDRSPRVKMPIYLEKHIEGVKHVLDERREKFRVDELPRKVVIAAYPPCVKRLYQTLISGEHLSHIGRFTLTSFLIHVGMSVDEVVKLYTSVSDFSESLTQYQVEHIAGQKGSGTKYRPPNCRSLSTHRLCPGPEEDCRNIRNPLNYYLRRIKMAELAG